MVHSEPEGEVGMIEKRIHREQEERRMKRGNVIQQMHYVLAIKLMTDKCACSKQSMLSNVYE